MQKCSYKPKKMLLVTIAILIHTIMVDVTIARNAWSCVNKQTSIGLFSCNLIASAKGLYSDNVLSAFLSSGSSVPQDSYIPKHAA